MYVKRKKIFVLLVFFLFNECFGLEKKKFIQFLDSRSSEYSKNNLSFSPLILSQNVILRKIFLKNNYNDTLDNELKFSENMKIGNETKGENFNNTNLRKKNIFRNSKENKGNIYAFEPFNQKTERHFNTLEKINSYKNISSTYIFKTDEQKEELPLEKSKNKEYETILKKEGNSKGNSKNNTDINNEGNSPIFNELINKKLIDNFKNICNQVYKKTFNFKDSYKVHNSSILTLYKNSLEHEEDKNYDLIGYGEMKNVSAYTLNYSLNNIESIKMWNKNIKRLNYVNISKDLLLKKRSKSAMLNINKYIVNNENDIENDKKNILYLVNSLPWPFKSHDVIYEAYQNYDENNNMFIIINKSINGIFKENKNFSRIQNYENFICIYPKSKNFFEKGLDYVISMYYNASIPKFIQNNLFSHLFPSLIYNLYNYSQKETNKKKDIKNEDQMKLVTQDDLKNYEKDNNKKREIENKKLNTKLDNKSSCFEKKSFKCTFTEKAISIWKRKKKLFKKLFYYLYYIF